MVLRCSSLINFKFKNNLIDLQKTKTNHILEGSNRGQNTRSFIYINQLVKYHSQLILSVLRTTN